MRRNFHQLKRYSGKPEDYDDWSCRMKQFLSEKTGMTAFTKWAEEQPQDVTQDEVEGGTR